MRIFAATFLAFVTLTAMAAQAGDRVTLGFGRNFNNDFIGDGEDRWRTSSYAISYVRGEPWRGELPDRIGELLEYRLRLESITASNAENPAAGDRRYVGLLSLGAHTHARHQGIELSMGGDLVMVGPMTRIGLMHRKAHKILSQPLPDITDQMPDAVYPTATFEVGRSFPLGEAAELRPFVQASAGVESLVRVGGDLRIGGAIAGDLLLRDVVTGQFYRGTHGAGQGRYSFMLGADTARVFDSYLLQGSDGFVLTDHRSRVRAGVHWQGESASAFYGVTWLSEEFTAQAEPQAVGSLQLRLRF